MSTWELIYNPNFKVVESDHFKTQADLPSFVLSASEWIEKINAVLIAENSPQKDRLVKLNRIAIQQMSILENIENKKYLK